MKAIYINVLSLDGGLVKTCDMNIPRENMEQALLPRLSVPASPEKHCATLRVANVTRAWENGKVLFFDDSFEHEVFNHCDDERVVFQLVFAHPDLGNGEEAIKCAIGEGPCMVEL